MGQFEQPILKMLKEGVLQSGAVAPGDGVAVNVSEKEIATIYIYGTSATRTINFQGSVDGTNYTSINGVRLSDLTVSTNTTGTNEIWQFDVTGLKKIRTPIAAVAGGNVSISANLK